MALKYKQIEQFMRYKINSPDFNPGDRFYSEAELKKRFGVSSSTVIKAINVLVQEGLLTRQQGKGTFVAKKIPEAIGLHRNADGESVAVINIKKEADARILSELGNPQASHYYHIIRLRKIDNVPVYVQHTYLRPTYFNHRALTDSDYYTTIYEQVQRDSGLDLFTAPMIETTEIAFPMPQKDAELLNMQGTPVPAAKISRHSFLANGECVEFVESYKRWDYFEVEIERR